jgi:ankyrin repeat protein
MTNNKKSTALLLCDSQVALARIESLLKVTDRILSTRYLDIGLHEAAEKGYLEVVKALIEKGEDVNAKGNYPSPPLYSAALNGHIEVVKYLVENGAVINPQDKVMSPLLLAALNRHTDVVNYLLDKGAEVLIVEQIVGHVCLYVTKSIGNIESIKYLIDNCADINANDNNGISLLYTAVLLGNLEIVTYLIEKGADVNVINILFGKSPLHVAAENGFINVTKLLVEKGANLNVKDRREKTPLFYAESKNHYIVANYLKALGAK